ncbi:MAG: thrombospondin type 3 repeat-containing protein [Myxococcaceae bacterium]|nr:thrombospondin type 3 repeat-containing protein [Myxococcaceae bacterium]
MTLTLLSLVLATPNFPAELQRLANADVLPDCAVCHQGTPAAGTVVTPFGTAMREAGLKANDVASLEAAWAQLEEHDSDGDGVSDKQALAEGENPNGKGFSYGCASAPWAGWFFGLPWLLWLRARSVRRV